MLGLGLSTNQSCVVLECFVLDAEFNGLVFGLVLGLVVVGLFLVLI